MCVYVCTFMCVHACMFMCAYSCVYICVCKHVHVCLYVCVCMGLSCGSQKLVSDIFLNHFSTLLFFICLLACFEAGSLTKWRGWLASSLRVMPMSGAMPGFSHERWGSELRSSCGRSQHFTYVAFSQSHDQSYCAVNLNNIARSVVPISTRQAFPALHLGGERHPPPSPELQLAVSGEGRRAHGLNHLAMGWRADCS